MPKAVYHRNTIEIAFYQAYFDDVWIWINDVESIVRVALVECERCGLSAMDSLHVAVAFLAEAEVLYTLEREEKPIYRTKLIKIQCVTGGE